MIFEHITDKNLERRFQKESKEVNRRLTTIRKLLSSSYIPKKYTVKQLREKSKGNIITILEIRYRSIMHYKNELEKYRVEMKLILRKYKKALIENYQLRKCKSKKHMKRKIGIKSFKTRIILR